MAGTHLAPNAALDTPAELSTSTHVKASGLATAAPMSDSTTDEGVCRLFTVTRELRDDVYRELLIFEGKDWKKHCWPAVLATCRQVHHQPAGYGEWPGIIVYYGRGSAHCMNAGRRRLVVWI